MNELSSRIVEAVLENLRGRQGFDYIIEGIPDDVMNEELIPELKIVVEGELKK